MGKTKAFTSNFSQNTEKLSCYYEREPNMAPIFVSVKCLQRILCAIEFFTFQKYTRPSYIRVEFNLNLRKLKVFFFLRSGCLTFCLPIIWINRILAANWQWYKEQKVDITFKCRTVPSRLGFDCFWLCFAVWHCYVNNFYVVSKRLSPSTFIQFLFPFLFSFHIERSKWNENCKRFSMSI